MNEIMNKDELKEKVVDYASKVFFYCVKRCNNRMDAEDLSQTILLEVINNIDKGARIENLDYYIWGVCKNQYNMYLRKTIKERNKLDYVDEIDQVDESKTALEEMIEDEKIRKMNRAIKLLSNDYREILYAYYVEDKTLKFIANELNIPFGTVTWKLSKIREKLKEYLDMEKLNGKKAYLPKSFVSSATYREKLPFDIHETVNPLFVKNLLWHTYENPCTIEDLSIEMGMSLPYVEDVVNTLLGRQYLIKENNKYKSNVVFVTHDIIEKVDNYLNEYEYIYLDKVIEFAKNNLHIYKEGLDNLETPDDLLMWSFLMMIISYTSSQEIVRTKEYNGSKWSVCLTEFKEDYNRNDFLMSWNGFGDRKKYSVYGDAYPAAQVPFSIHKTHDRIKYHNSTNGFNTDPYIISNIIFKDLEYDKLDKNDKKEIDNALKLNIVKLEDNKIKLVIPTIKEENFKELKLMILKDTTLENSYNELFNKIISVIESNIPKYLKEEASFVASTLLNPLRSHLLIKAYEQGLLGMDEEHEFFVYNMYIVRK